MIIRCAKRTGGSNPNPSHAAGKSDRESDVESLLSHLSDVVVSYDTELRYTFVNRAGASLLGTFLTSIAGVAFYSLIGPHFAAGLAVRPDWLLGGLFGLGGLGGMYLGAKCQKFMPERFIKALLAAMLLFLGVKYMLQIWV